MSNTLAPPAGHDRQESLSAVYFHANDTEARSRAASKQDGEDAKSGAITANTKTNSSADSTSGEAKSSDGIEMQTSPASPTATLQQLSSPTGTSRDLLDLKVLPSSSLSDVTQAPDFQKSKDGGEHKETCWTRKKGCNRAAVWVIFFAVVGTIDWVVPLFIPSLFMYLINSQVCDKLCVPIPQAGWVENINNPNDWNINKFLSNTNRSWWPEETFSVYLFHINNSDAVLAGTESKLKVQQVGPYVFNTYRLKYNVSFSADNQQVFYNDLMSYTFRPDLSNGLLLTDRITTINLPLVSTNTMEWAILQAPLNAFTGSLCFTDKSGTNFGSCLFQKNSTVEDVLFSSTSELYESSNGLLQGNLAPTFQMFFNYSTDTAVADEQRLVNSFGLGGKIHTFVGTILSAHITPVQINITGHPTANDSLLTAQYTGHGGSLDKLFGYTQYKGNSSVNVWNGAEPIRGTDHFQFSLMVTPNDILTVWDDDVMRNVDLQFQEKVSVIGKYDAYRYVPTDSLFGGNDPHYFGTGVGNEGLLTGSPASMIKYGAPVSAFASRPYQAGVNSALASTVICTNCPDMTDPNDWLQVYVDVEPNTGKVLGGKKRGQINALIGQSYIYNNTNYGPYASTVYSKLPLSLVPVVYFEYSSEIESGYQTDQMDDAITQLKLASVGTAVFFYLTLSLAVVNYIQAFVVAMKAWENGTWWWNDERLQHRHAKTAVKTVTV